METATGLPAPVLRLEEQDPLLGLDRNDVFLKLSALLTGVEDLDPELGADYLQKLEPGYGPKIKELCELYYEIVRQPDPIAALVVDLAEDAQLANAARQIVKIWMLSQFEDPGGKVTLAGHFERGLVWRIIDAHPPAFSARRHGYWTQAPHE